jgi:hypothetical protein
VWSYGCAEGGEMNKEYWDQLPKKECGICRKLFPEASLLLVREDSDKVMCTGCALNYEHDVVNSFFKLLGKKK